MVLHADRGGALPGADSTSVSPGFTWGKSGNVGSGTYLLNDTVPSNIAGRLVSIEEGIISEIFVTSQDVDTFVVAIEKRNGATFIELATLTVTAGRTATGSYSALVYRGDELACRIKSGSCKNPVVGIIMQGDTA